jgi:hypothetical protein
VTRDVRPLLKEFFVSDLKKSGLKDQFWARAVSLNVPQGADLNENDLLNYYALKFNVDYLSTLYYAGKISLDSPDIEKPQFLESLLPQSIIEYLKGLTPPEENTKPKDLANWISSVNENTLRLWQQEFAKNPPEEAELFKKNLTSFAVHLNNPKNHWGQPSVRLVEKSFDGAPSGRRFIRMEIPYHVGLVLVEESGQFKIWFAAAFIPPD